MEYFFILPIFLIFWCSKGYFLFEKHLHHQIQGFGEIIRIYQQNYPKMGKNNDLGILLFLSLFRSFRVPLSIYVLYLWMLCRDILHNTIDYLSPNLGRLTIECHRDDLAQHSLKNCLGVPQGTVGKILKRHKQQIISYRFGVVVCRKSPNINIEQDIDRMCPTNSFFSKFQLKSIWRSAIRRPCSTPTVMDKLLCVRLRVGWTY